MKSFLVSVLIIGFLLCAPQAFAMNITINDGVGIGNLNQGGEDNEVEPNCIKAQYWDLEGVILNYSKLSIIGGYDFKTGRYGSGDLFLDVTGDAVYGVPARGLDGLSGNGKKTITNAYGYDFVVDIEWASLTYDVYQIDPNTQLTSAYYRLNDGSNPWRHESGGTKIDGASGTIAYTTGLSDAATGFKGDWLSTSGSHNRFSLDLSWLLAMGYTDFTSHFTMGCGNDNIMGRGTLTVPEPASILLLGMGLLGIIGLGRNRKR